MTETRREVTEAEYHECSSDRCPQCGKTFYLLATGWSVSVGYECPWCKSLVKHAKLREARATSP